MSGFDHESRRARFQARLAELSVDVAMCLPSGDLEYLTGFPRRAPSFGNIEYAHQWTTGALLRPEGEPVFVVPQGYSSFNLPGGVEGDVVQVRNLDDGVEVFARTLARFGRIRRIGLSARTFSRTAVRMVELTGGAELVDLDDEINALRRVKEPAELDAMRRSGRICDLTMGEITSSVAAGVTEFEISSRVEYLMRKHGGKYPSFDTGVFAMGPALDRDASTRLTAEPLVEGLGVSFDFGTVVDGYCSDFGRTIHIGEPDDRYREAYGLVVAAQEAGRRAAVPGATASEVNAATRAVIEEAGYGDWFRHRTGHCIGLDTHERPFISEEDTTVLEEGMTFTIEPSIFWPGTVGVRVEDMFVCRPGGAECLNTYSRDLVAV